MYSGFKPQLLRFPASFGKIDERVVSQVSCLRRLSTVLEIDNLLDFRQSDVRCLGWLRVIGLLEFRVWDLELSEIWICDGLQGLEIYEGGGGLWGLGTV